MPVSKKRKKNGRTATYKGYNPPKEASDNFYARAMGASSSPEFQKEMLRTNFELRERELRRERAKALAKGQSDPFVDEQEFFGSKFKVGDRIHSKKKDITRRIVEVQSFNGQISYAWVSNKEAGICSENTMVAYGNS